jgi:hypothetical protein
MSALEKVQKVQQARALQQLRSHHPSHRHSSISGIADDDTEAWYDARSATMSDSSVAFISNEERDEVARLAHELEEQEHAQRQLTVSVVRELEPATPNCVPNPPLLFAEKHWKYIPVGFGLGAKGETGTWRFAGVHSVNTLCLRSTGSTPW